MKETRKETGRGPTGKWKTRLKEVAYWFRSFFFNYLWVGIVLLLAAALFDVGYPQPRAFGLSVAIEILKSFGIAIIVASIFTFASGTSEFVNKIKDLLEQIVIKRDFLRNIAPASKKDALMSLIQPNDYERSKYPGIAEYYDYFIEKTLDIRKKCVRSNYQVNTRVFLDPTTNRIQAQGTYSYRLYPSADGFTDVTVGFEEEEPCAKCNYVAISTPEGARELYEESDIDDLLKDVDDGGDKSRRANIPVSKIGDGHERLDIELRVTECGSDHWALIAFKALQPTDGFRFYLHCEGDLRIRKHSIFVVGATYYLDESEDDRDISITCNQWINEGSGLTILVSLPHDKIPNNKL